MSKISNQISFSMIVLMKKHKDSLKKRAESISLMMMNSANQWRNTCLMNFQKKMNPSHFKKSLYQHNLQNNINQKLWPRQNKIQMQFIRNNKKLNLTKIQMKSLKKRRKRANWKIRKEIWMICQCQEWVTSLQNALKKPRVVR
jgi:hypothetical protein